MTKISRGVFSLISRPTPLIGGTKNLIAPATWRAIHTTDAEQIPEKKNVSACTALVPYRESSTATGLKGK